MEFFAQAKGIWTEEDLRSRLTIGSLVEHCASITEIIDTGDGVSGEIYSVWGQFKLERSLVRGGVRFAMPTCPNAMAWTVTTGFPPDPDAALIHCTINRPDHDPDFIESLEEFVEDWRVGLEKAA
ncbi:hypothetical protein [Magnetospira sp. QH-2]|uniref:hypothetical protein n=1 Tax=Magnetospira sp. (strain QH-2) TaxID=1288970 RepID=UPI0003E8157D|nr:hypothetical protein [Magnetospira sp. QH-2]CCQ73299.1 Conserved protein of unknown function [Magnetospira sp. QH-2]